MIFSIVFDNNASPNQYLYANDFNSKRVQKIDGSGNSITFATNVNTFSMAFDNNSNLLETNYITGTINIIDTQGNVTTLIQDNDNFVPVSIAFNNNYSLLYVLNNSPIYIF